MSNTNYVFAPVAGTIVKVKVQVKERIKEDDPVCSLKPNAGGDELNVPTPVSGSVKQVFVTEGDMVNQGDKIAEIITDPIDSTKIAGEWYNQLGSKMILEVDNKPDGGLSGKYNSAVGNADDFYILAGRFDTEPPAYGGVSVGWTVTYRNEIHPNAHSTATWSGQYFDNGPDFDKERILTHWLLTTSQPTKYTWKSTNVGHDTFTRDKPCPAEIAMAQALTVGSPHPEAILAMYERHA